LTRDSFQRRVSDSIKAGETGIAEDDDGTSLGTIAVDSTADAGLWKPEELRVAYVIHRMITDRMSAGTDIGSTLIDHPRPPRPERNSRIRLILDVWTTIEGLHRYSTTDPKDPTTSAQSPAAGHPAQHSSNGKSESQQRQDTNRRNSIPASTVNIATAITAPYHQTRWMSWMRRSSPGRRTSRTRWSRRTRKARPGHLVVHERRLTRATIYR
jgi:hypothetical protein